MRPVADPCPKRARAAAASPRPAHQRRRRGGDPGTPLPRPGAQPRRCPRPTGRPAPRGHPGAGTSASPPAPRAPRKERRLQGQAAPRPHQAHALARLEPRMSGRPARAATEGAARASRPAVPPCRLLLRLAGWRLMGESARRAEADHHRRAALLVLGRHLGTDDEGRAGPGHQHHDQEGSDGRPAGSDAAPLRPDPDRPQGGHRRRRADAQRASTSASACGWASPRKARASRSSAGSPVSCASPRPRRCRSCRCSSTTPARPSRLARCSTPAATSTPTSRASAALFAGRARQASRRLTARRAHACKRCRSAGLSAPNGRIRRTRGG